MTIRTLLIALLLMAALAAGYLLQSKSSVPATTTATVRAATILPIPTDLPDFQLIDQHGNAFNNRSFDGQWHLLFFGFTHCPDICPATLQRLSTVKKQLASQGSTVLPRIVLVSVDPERDTPDVIGQYVSYFGTNNIGVTGDLDELQKLTSGLGIYFAKQAAGETTDNYGVDHSSAVLIIDPDGKFHGLFSGEPTIDDYVFDLSQIFSRAALPLVASDVSVFEPVPGSPMSVGYMTLSNQSNADIEVVQVSSEQFDSVQMHTTATVDGVARMRPLDAILVPANGAVTLTPGADHLMLRGFRGDDRAIQLRLQAKDEKEFIISTPLTPRQP